MICQDRDRGRRAKERSWGCRGCMAAQWRGWESPMVVWWDRRVQLMGLMRVRIDRGRTNPMGRAAVESRCVFSGSDR